MVLWIPAFAGMTNYDTVSFARMTRERFKVYAFFLAFSARRAEARAVAEIPRRCLSARVRCLRVVVFRIVVLEWVWESICEKVVLERRK